jgi:hypothetical protein
MARNLKGETEFGLPILPLLPDLDGNPSHIPALSDQDAVDAGAVGANSPLYSMGEELREIYALGDGPFGPTEPKAGTQ